MRTIQRSAFCLGIAFYFGVFTFSSLGYASSSDLLYVQDGHNLITYGVNATTAIASKLGNVHLDADPNAIVYKGFGLQVVHAPSAPFLYLLGFTSPNQEYFWVYATTSKGVATGAPIQTLSVKPALTQFFVHPNGKFAYALYSWNAHDSCHSFVADIVLYTIDPKTGLLANTTKPIASFPANCYVKSSLVGLNHVGSKLYTNGYNEAFENNDNTFSYYTVDGKTGLLSKGIQFWNLDTGPDGGAFYTVSDNLFAFWNLGDDSLSPGVYVYANGSSLKTPIFVCFAKMAAVCGDSQNDFDTLQFDPSGQYLLFNDDTVSSVVIAHVDLKNKRLRETGSSIPGNPAVISFSPDDKLVYTDSGYLAGANNKEVQIHSFNSSSGLITARSSFTLPSDVRTILPFSLP